MIPARRRLPLLLIAAAAAALLLTALPAQAPATVEEQRARLPPPARECPDPVEGTWIGQHQPHTWWSRYTLTVQRKAPGSPDLTGHIETLAWIGSAQDTTPPPCTPGGAEVVVDQPASGTWDGQHITFGASTWTLRETRCGALSGYYPDTFDGDIDPRLNEFQTIREDGHNAAATVVFRRVACGPAPATQPLPELPPPTRPPSAGCACF
jgi:hypothetical protein